MATIGGNFVNASPIGDFTVFFLALNAELTLTDNAISRRVKLRDFFKGYKQLDRKAGEYVSEIRFRIPSKHTSFNFEKVSKRTNLDIASVNSAMMIAVGDKIIQSASISAGGVAPVPLFLKDTSAFLNAKELSEKLILEACDIASGEITPISDARGSADYKRFLLQQLIKAHFITLFPDLQVRKLLAYEEY
jgi:xanthine dehydrogenase small subunit